MAGTFALGLHATLLVPIRPTLSGRVSTDAVPAMTVRLLSQETASGAVSSADKLALATVQPEAPSTATGLRVGDKAVEARPASPAAASGAVAKAPLSTDAVLSPPVEPGLPRAPTYLSGGRLDPGPQPLEDVTPVYPEEAQGQEGSVVLRLLINESGAVDNVAVVRAYPVGLFEKSALDAFGKARFSPGRMLGVAVKSQITIEVMFTPINRGKVSGRSY